MIYTDRIVRTAQDFLARAAESKSLPQPRIRVHSIAPRFCVLAVDSLATPDFLSSNMPALALELGCRANQIRCGYPLLDQPHTGWIEVGSEETVPFSETDLLMTLAKHPGTIAELLDPRRLVVPLGLGTAPVLLDFDRTPHLLIGGGTGSGKSVLIRHIINYILTSCSNTTLFLVDPKTVEFAAYERLHHMGENEWSDPITHDPAIGKIILGVDKLDEIHLLLESLCEIMEFRFRAFAESGSRHLSEFVTSKSGVSANEPLIYSDLVRRLRNQVRGCANDLSATDKNACDSHELHSTAAKLLCNRFVLIVDEVNDLLMAAPKADRALLIERLTRLAQKGRAAGIHVILATQRPSVDAIPGTLKANLPGRLALKCSSTTDSNIILGRGDAARLIGRGDALLSEGGSDPIRFQVPFVSDSDQSMQVAIYCAALGIPAINLCLFASQECAISLDDANGWFYQWVHTLASENSWYALTPKEFLTARVKKSPESAPVFVEATTAEIPNELPGVNAPVSSGSGTIELGESKEQEVPTPDSTMIRVVNPGLRKLLARSANYGGTTWGWQDILKMANDQPERIFTYGELSETFAGHRNAGQAVGSAMRAICRRGRHDVCRRVVEESTGRPAAPCGIS